jgi:predicted nucleic acid-binding protein
VRQIVSDTGPLISLEKLSQGYDFIRQLYDKLIIAPAVLEEVAAGQFATPEEYLQHYGISDLIEVRMVSQPHKLPEAERLHEGETQAIGRRIAQSVGIQISGVAGQIIKAFRQDLIAATEVQNKLSELLRGGRINQKIYEALLTSLSEV